MSIADLELLTAKLPPIAFEMLARNSGYIIEKEFHVRGKKEETVNTLKVTGSVIIRDQYAVITEVNKPIHIEDMYASLYDGDNIIFLTAPTGAELHNVPVGTIFTRDKLSTEPFSVFPTNECRLIEGKETKIGLPFVVAQKYNEDTFIRFHYTALEPADFKMKIIFEYTPLAGGKLEFL